MPLVPQQPGANNRTPAVYTAATSIVAPLQQVQQALAAHPHATLLDAARLIQSLQAEYGEQARLEDIIQEYVARQLAAQIAQRLATKNVQVTL